MRLPRTIRFGSYTLNDKESGESKPPNGMREGTSTKKSGTRTSVCRLVATGLVGWLRRGARRQRQLGQLLLRDLTWPLAEDDHPEHLVGRHVAGLDDIDHAAVVHDADPVG